MFEWLLSKGDEPSPDWTTCIETGFVAYYQASQNYYPIYMEDGWAKWNEDGIWYCYKHHS